MDATPTSNSETPATRSGEQRVRGARTESRASLSTWILVAAAVVAILACMANGGSAASLALITLFTGAGLLIVPPKNRPPLVLAVCALLAVTAAALAFLPATLFGSLPEWRWHLIEDWGFELPACITCQPAFTLGGIVTLAAACAWFFVLVGLGMGESARRAALRTVTLGIYLIAAMALVQKLGWLDFGWPLGLPHAAEDLGPFANRNHFSSLCAIGCVLGAGMTQDAHRKKSSLVFLFGAGLLLPFAGIVINTSRAGLLLFFIGLILWLTTASLRHGLFRIVALTFSMILCAVTVLLLFGGGSGARLVTEGIGQSGIGGRGVIYEETFRFLMQSPWIGIGLGNFDPLFSLQHAIPITTARIIHPESDWLWWWSEAGLLGVLPLAFALVWLLRHGFPRPGSRKKSRHHRQDQRLRGVSAIGLLLAALHGVFDVPLHGIGYASVVLLLAACVLPRRHQGSSPDLIGTTAYRLAGLALICLGGAQFLAAHGQPALSDRTALKVRSGAIHLLASSGRHQEALREVDKALSLAPLDWSLHFQRGLLRLQLRQPAGAALEDFNRARILEPNNANLRLEEGRLWLEHQPSIAIVPWRELLRLTRDPGYYVQFISLARAHPELASPIRLLAETPTLKAAYAVHGAPQELWQSALQDLLTVDPQLNQIDTDLRLQLFHAWQARGDRDQLLAAIESHPTWHEQVWPLLAEEYARRSDFEKAWNLQKTHAFSMVPAATPTDQNISQLERNFHFNPLDTRLGVELYFAQKRSGQLPEARRTLDRLLAQPNPPDFLHQELAALHAEQGDFRQAYETMKQAMAPKSR